MSNTHPAHVNVGSPAIFTHHNNVTELDTHTGMTNAVVSGGLQEAIVNSTTLRGHNNQNSLKRAATYSIHPPARRNGVEPGARTSIDAAAAPVAVFNQFRGSENTTTEFPAASDVLTPNTLDASFPNPPVAGPLGSSDNVLNTNTEVTPTLNHINLQAEGIHENNIVMRAYCAVGDNRPLYPVLHGQELKAHLDYINCMNRWVYNGGVGDPHPITPVEQRLFATDKWPEHLLLRRLHNAARILPKEQRLYAIANVCNYPLDETEGWEMLDSERSYEECRLFPTQWEPSPFAQGTQAPVQYHTDEFNFDPARGYILNSQPHSALAVYPPRIAPFEYRPQDFVFTPKDGYLLAALTTHSASVMEDLRAEPTNPETIERATFTSNPFINPIFTSSGVRGVIDRDDNGDGTGAAVQAQAELALVRDMSSVRPPAAITIPDSPPVAITGARAVRHGCRTGEINRKKAKPPTANTTGDPGPSTARARMSALASSTWNHVNMTTVAPCNATTTCGAGFSTLTAAAANPPAAFALPSTWNTDLLSPPAQSTSSSASPFVSPQAASAPTLVGPFNRYGAPRWRFVDEYRDWVDPNAGLMEREDNPAATKRNAIRRQRQEHAAWQAAVRDAVVVDQV
jgi:hypothetical protein